MFSIVPEPPFNGAVSERTRISLLITWESNQIGISYLITVDGKSLTTSRTSHVLDGLTPDTEYTINIYSISGEQTSVAFVFRGRTCKNIPHNCSA